MLNGQQELIALDLDPEWEATAQRDAARVLRAKPRLNEADASEEADYPVVDLDSLDVLRPRSVGIEHVARSVVRQVELDRKLIALGLTGPQVNAAVATRVARTVAPGSTRPTKGCRNPVAWVN